MKRIFIAIQYMELGGAERALLGLLDALDASRFQVDLFVYRHSGELMPLIPSKVNLLPELPAYRAISRPLKDILLEGKLGIAGARLWAKWRSARFGKRLDGPENYAVFDDAAAAVSPFLPSLKKLGVYDLAISFLTPHRIVRDKVRARRKIAWIHTDYSSIGINVERELPVWRAYDHIISISPQAGRGFLSRFPELEGRLVQMENIVSPEAVREQAALEDVSGVMGGSPCLCTVGRFSHAKGMDRAVRLAARLVGLGMERLRWYLIGYGDEASLRREIRDCGMEEHVIILGKKANPYPYMAACDLYVQPSRYEGKAVAVREAQILGRPVAVTRFPTSAGHLEDGVDGLIIPNEEEGAAVELFRLLNDAARLESLSAECRRRDYGNRDEILKLEELI